jgi:hypothetical protein
VPLSRSVKVVRVMERPCLMMKVIAIVSLGVVSLVVIAVAH